MSIITLKQKRELLSSAFGEGIVSSNGKDVAVYCPVCLKSPKVKKKKKVRSTQRFCRCLNKRSKIPCFKVGNPFYCLTFTWFLTWYIYDIYYIYNEGLVDQFNSDPKCYIKKLS